MPVNQMKETYSALFKSYGEVTLDHQIKKLTELDAYMPYNSTFFSLINTTKLSFDFMSKNFEVCIGINPQEMKAKGMAHFWSLIHPEDLKSYLEALQDIIAFTLKKIPLEERKYMCYTYNYRIKNATGDYVQLIQNSTPLHFDEAGKPVIGMAHYTVLEPGIEFSISATAKYMKGDNKFETVFSKNYG
ncbi:PAS domain-containing protein [Flavobacteriaceae bacterium KMM 6898]|nr:PAS domain-containing protein [Flavobacteriaceae bacterium KMM 6898]